MFYFLKFFSIKIRTLNQFLYSTFFFLHVSWLFLWIGVSRNSFLNQFFYFQLLFLLSICSFLILFRLFIQNVWLILRINSIYFFLRLIEFCWSCYFFQLSTFFWLFLSTTCLIFYYMNFFLLMDRGFMAVVFKIRIICRFFSIFWSGKLFWRHTFITRNCSSWKWFLILIIMFLCELISFLLFSMLKVILPGEYLVHAGFIAPWFSRLSKCVLGGKGIFEGLISGTDRFWCYNFSDHIQDNSAKN